MFPSGVPVGYRNIRFADGKAGIAIDPNKAEEVAELFRLYSSGKYTLKSLARPKWAYPQMLKKIFDNPFYFGEFRWKGKQYKGTHEPIVSRDVNYVPWKLQSASVWMKLFRY